MRLRVFKNSADRRIACFTLDNSGADLPTESLERCSRWIRQVPAQDRMPAFGYGLKDKAKANADIAKQGYHIYRQERIARFS